MELLQQDIFGEKHKTIQEKEKKQPTSAASKAFREMSLADGINEKEITNEFMLILRILQRKILFSGLLSTKTKDMFLRILLNELSIKSGKTDPATAVRDSLIAFFGK
ncbi:MAG: hypothetical protein LBU35_02375 [Holosporales bacterium]|jgi:hypothetical protein|nr:hypothetical protein [Holosporales bacterium]